MPLCRIATDNPWTGLETTRSSDSVYLMNQASM
jgi:hypothetical protein